MKIEWTDYLRYKATLRGFDLGIIESILKFSPERYFDSAAGRRAAVGRHDDKLVIVPYEANEEVIVPITIHAITRQQINFRIRIGRFIHEQNQTNIL
ncbi:hypothetical protein HUU39_07345 [candidate division KSB1 bacterium]|nr:hypothetical protein [bacterium]NUM65079.1 hypothetical protein [candidate division KSB1 bacterium]